MASSRLPVLRGPDTLQTRVQDNVQQLVSPTVRALQSTPIMGAAPPPWTTPSLLNGFSAAGAPFFTPAFQIDALGYVHFRGAALNAAGCAANTVLFQLPAAARPGATHLFVASDGGNLRGFNVAATGNVSTTSVLAAGAGLSLECVFQAGG